VAFGVADLEAHAHPATVRGVRRNRDGHGYVSMSGLRRSAEIAVSRCRGSWAAVCTLVGLIEVGIVAAGLVAASYAGGMQLTELSVMGFRTPVIVFRRPAGGLRWVIIPTIHMGHADYYWAIWQRLRSCQAVVAEIWDGPSSTGMVYANAMRLARQRASRALVPRTSTTARSAYRSSSRTTTWRRRRTRIAGCPVRSG
jgi:hypothetical protein